MDDRDRLAFYPFVDLRIACRVCSRNGAYRLARLAAIGRKSPRDLLERFSYDCLWRGGAWQARRFSVRRAGPRAASAAQLAARPRATPGRSQ